MFSGRILIYPSWNWCTEEVYSLKRSVKSAHWDGFLELRVKLDWSPSKQVTQSSTAKFPTSPTENAAKYCTLLFLLYLSQTGWALSPGLSLMFQFFKWLQKFLKISRGNCYWNGEYAFQKSLFRLTAMFHLPVDRFRHLEVHGPFSLPPQLFQFSFLLSSKVFQKKQIWISAVAASRKKKCVSLLLLFRTFS